MDTTRHEVSSFAFSYLRSSACRPGRLPAPGVEGRVADPVLPVQLLRRQPMSFSTPMIRSSENRDRFMACLLSKEAGQRAARAVRTPRNFRPGVAAAAYPAPAGFQDMDNAGDDPAASARGLPRVSVGRWCNPRTAPCSVSWGRRGQNRPLVRRDSMSSQEPQVVRTSSVI